MCTVSFLPHSRGFYLGMNRDESLLRAPAISPRLVPCGGRFGLFPSEPAGGSWIGINDAGLCVALINWYAIAPGAGAGRVSRGIIVPSLLRAKDVVEVRERIDALPKRDIAPFRLLMFARRGRVVREFRWNQRELAELAHEWQPRHWFSSGCDEARAQRERDAVAFEAWRHSQAGSLAWLRRLHASHEPVRGPFCFCMHRHGAATVSYTELVVTRRMATMRYHDGPLCLAPEPAASQRIEFCAVCKESPAIPTNEQTGDAHEDQHRSPESAHCPLLPGRFSTGREVLEVARRGNLVDAAHLRASGK